MSTTDHPTTTGAEHGSRPRRGRGRLAAAALAATAVGGLGVVGLGSPAGAVVDGRDTNITETPYQVALMFDGGHGCGGSIVSDRVIVTAAHCTEGSPVESLSILAGASDLDEEGQRIAVKTVVEAPEYARTGLGDVAVLVLEQPLRFNDKVQPIALASASEIADATTGVVSGWGDLSESGSEGSPSTLQSAEVPMVSDAACEVAVGSDGEAETCAGGTGTDSCYGDSGGPLAIQVDGVTKLAGITSWGEECGGDTPGVYADVATFTPMINEVVEAPDAAETVRTGDGPTDEAGTDGVDEGDEFDFGPEDEDDWFFEDEGDFEGEDDWFFEDEGDFEGEDDWFFEDEGDLDGEDDWFFEDEGDLDDFDFEDGEWLDGEHCEELAAA